MENEFNTNAAKVLLTPGERRLRFKLSCKGIRPEPGNVEALLNAAAERMGTLEYKEDVLRRLLNEVECLPEMLIDLKITLNDAPANELGKILARVKKALRKAKGGN